MPRVRSCAWPTSPVPPPAPGAPLARSARLTPTTPRSTRSRIRPNLYPTSALPQSKAPVWRRTGRCTRNSGQRSYLGAQLSRDAGADSRRRWSSATSTRLSPQCLTSTRPSPTGPVTRCPPKRQTTCMGCCARWSSNSENSPAPGPRTQLKPFALSSNLLVSLRGRARDSRDFAAGDEIRDFLTSAGVELRDTAAGPTWSIRTGPSLD